MKTRRWMKTALNEAKKAEEIQLPWQRQTRAKRCVPAKPARLKVVG